ncbi:MAG: nreC, partial [Dehalococcoidia bacterium]|nr:nreC [Dehalococcoidia bacterium]
MLEKVSKQLPDVVLMDSAMPIMNGVEVTHQLRKRNVTSKVLLITIYENKEVILAALRAGVNGFISKNATGSDLVSAILAVSRGDFFLYPSVAKIMVRDYLQDLKK